MANKLFIKSTFFNLLSVRCIIEYYKFFFEVITVFGFSNFKEIPKPFLKNICENTIWILFLKLLLSIFTIVKVMVISICTIYLLGEFLYVNWGCNLCFYVGRTCRIVKSLIRKGIHASLCKVVGLWMLMYNFLPDMFIISVEYFGINYSIVIC